MTVDFEDNIQLLFVVHDVVNVMAAYQWCTAHLHNRLVCCRDIDHVINDEDIQP
jgi:hypothetical protein